MANVNIDTSSKKEQRNFGIVMAVAISLVTLIHWLIRGREELSHWPFYLAGLFLVLALILPKLLEPVFVFWMKFAVVVNWVMTRLLLSSVWFAIITPMRIGIALMGKDPLKQNYMPRAATYWEDAEEQPKDLEDYRNQF